ncbi:hypothetical protein MAMC_00306 [Methylacidimicrobium cyclopophantes]|uniref:4'-phosphopantetheinyl transferase domain-containing protein n=1 Tax=Methylacidimicrobium cyclopophantes TaxID=1041766 RepID=A0A5E6M6E4_9BACT|nr:4'-phosphopantetheinyl transferase superfamily protein [Methylacidimicrobium cyclopophantes]VVM04927.1 hypothetical protein MAMC_00306 [Methylacidimicrobium cyclopophantes]
MIRSPDPASTACRLPFLGKILRFSPERFVEVESCLSLDEALFLADHLFPFTPGERAPEGSLAILPLAMSLEAMAEAAACLAPGLGWVGFRRVHASRWISVEEPIRTVLRAESRPCKASRRPVEVVVSLHPEEQAGAAVSGLALFADRYSAQISFSFGAVEKGGERSLTGEEAYARGLLFHGPSLRCLVGPLFLGRKIALGHFLVRPRGGLFRSRPNPELLCDPQLLDGIAQLVALWARREGRIVFPVGFSHLEVYGPPPPPGSRLRAGITIREEKGPILLANAELVDSRERSWLRVEGWRGWSLRLPEKLTDFALSSGSRFLGEPIELSGRSARTAAILLPATAWGDFPEELLARGSLQARELVEWKSLDRPILGRREWLLGRLALKEALRLLLGSVSPSSPSPHLRALALVGERGSAPRLCDAPLASSPHLSLAHASGFALGAASEAPIGVDLEPIREPGELLWEALSEEERKAVSSFAKANAQEGFFRLWCAKEAAGKLFGSGLGRGPRALEARWQGEGDFLVRLRGSGSETVVRTAVREGNVLAWTR